jgi:hypothetical protein
MAERRDDDHWLARPATIRILWIVFATILALSVIAEFAIEPHGKFGVDGSFGFSAWYGFAACAVLILAARLLGLFLKRRSDYYDG